MSVTVVEKLDPALTWPKEEPTFEELRRFLVAWGNRLCGMTWGHIAHKPGSPGFREYLACVARMQSTFDTVLLLDALHSVDPVKAEATARAIWAAADAGDSYGEWFWEWAEGIGLDPDGLYNDGIALAESWTPGYEVIDPSPAASKADGGKGNGDA